VNSDYVELEAVSSTHVRVKMLNPWTGKAWNEPTIPTTALSYSAIPNWKIYLVAADGKQFGPVGFGMVQNLRHKEFVGIGVRHGGLLTVDCAEQHAAFRDLKKVPCIALNGGYRYLFASNELGLELDVPRLGFVRSQRGGGWVDETLIMLPGPEVNPEAGTWIQPPGAWVQNVPAEVMLAIRQAASVL
jgi:hypothetical protein